MNVIEKAHELGQMLADSAEFKRLREADEAQKNDADAQLLLVAYNKKRAELMVKAQKENITPDEMQEIRNEMDAEFAKLNKSKVIMEFVDAMQQFNDLMGQVNFAVTSYVSPKQEESCGGDCGGCSGCH